ncbi:hypothetical protein UY3_08904 [Chelonia mydas]|uniref:Uncharacterized protein n=1 Tax=Chelonia mydas TaxID=8469 RepID=M7C0Q7_CHEMY|nr:hypothetical protein UY3_08904 [Chelonia mydas]
MSGTRCSGASPKTCRFCKQLDAILGGNPTSIAKSAVDTSEGTDAEDKVIDEEVELDEDVQLQAGSPGGAGSQELFSIPEVSSQSQQSLFGEQEAGDEMAGSSPIDVTMQHGEKFSVRALLQQEMPAVNML